jgi:hypothetical protein
MKILAGSAVIIALHAIAQVAAAQTGSAPFCLQPAAGAGARCVFGTMAECERARASTSSGQCMTRTDAHGTTGLGEPTVGSPDSATQRPPSTGR